MKRKIEFVCTGNLGRSPVAELVAQNYVRSGGLEEYIISSSGTDVDRINSNEPDGGLVRHLVKLGLDRHFFDSSQSEKAQILLESSKYDSEAGLYLYRASIRKALIEERDLRDTALKIEGIVETPKLISTQTIPDPLTSAVFCMDPKSREKAERIYSKAPNMPLIKIINDYIRKKQLPECFGTGNLENYKTMVRALAEYVPRAIDKFDREK